MAMDSFGNTGPPRIFLDYSDPKYDPIARRKASLDESRSSLFHFLEGIQSGTVIGAGLLGAMAYQGSRRRKTSRRS